MDNMIKVKDNMCGRPFVRINQARTGGSNMNGNSQNESR